MIRTKLDQVSGGSQMSWEHSSLIGDFYFLVNELNTKVSQIEVYDFIKLQGDMYESQGNKDIYEIECLPYLDAYKKFGLPIIELLRLYSKESYSRMGQRFTDSDIDEINIGYLSSWGFKYKNYRWYFKEEYVAMGDPLPLDASRREQLPIEGYEIDVNLVANCYFEDEKMFIDVVHNLPNKTNLMFSLRNSKEAYFAQSKGFCENNHAKSEGFTNKGSKIKDGLYQLNVSSSIYSVQDKEAKLALGEGNKNLTGRNVKHSPIGGKTVEGHFSIVIEGNNIKVFD